MDITVTELKEKLERGDEFVFIDVREPYEYDEFNLGAELIPLGQLLSSLEELEEKKEKEIVVHCRTGSRSEAAKQFMQTQGFKNVRNLLGGVVAWRERFDENA